MGTEKVVGTRMDAATVERLEALAVVLDRTVSQLVRAAVERLLEAEERTLHPLSLEAAVSIGEAMEIETTILLENTSTLLSTSHGDAGGVYLLVHPETRELYVGSSTELTARLTHHRFCIKAGSHKNAAINGWSLDEVVVVILESQEQCEKTAETKRSLLAREQYFIDSLKNSKEWTLLNIAGALSEQRPSTQATVLPAVPAVPAPVKVQAVKGQQQSVSLKKQTSTPQLDAYATFYSNIIEQGLLPVLQEERSSRDVVSLFEGLDKKEQRWFLEFLRSYDSPWLKRLAEGGRFPWVSKLMLAAQV